ncbi:MAG: vWA domain-containing protein [Hyphomicrobiales bacterium]
MRHFIPLVTVLVLAICLALVSACTEGTGIYAGYHVAHEALHPGANRNRFPEAEPNPIRLAAEQPVSTFSIDVDTVSYAYARRSLNTGVLPEREAVRVEEMINYFSYAYPTPKRTDPPFRPTVAIYPTPWNRDTKLMHIGIKGYDIETTEKPRANLVFLIDASGSMSSDDRLPLLKRAFRLLLDTLGADDTVSIVAYAGGAGIVLEPTKASRKRTILRALGRLHAGGATAGAAGLREAYALAGQAFVKDGVNRVILATDGDFNIGISDPDALKRFIVEKRKSGIFLSVLGFGYGNLNDAVMQVLAQNGNGVAAYIDTLREAQKVLVDEASSTLFPIARDVKIQVEFNPATVAEYRLIGYETRALKREDFNNDKVDAGDIGSGHTVTAIYEITPVGAAGKVIDDLRYGLDGRKPAAGGNGEYAHLKLRYKLPNAKKSRRIALAITKAHEKAGIRQVSGEMRFAASVAAFGQKLRGEIHVDDMSYDAIRKLARSGRGADPHGRRSDFLSLVGLARSMSPRSLAAWN